MKFIDEIASLSTATLFVYCLDLHLHRTRSRFASDQSDAPAVCTNLFDYFEYHSFMAFTKSHTFFC